MFFGFIGALVAKVLGFFGGGVVRGVLATIANREVQVTTRQGLYLTALTTALTADIEARKIASTERIALWSSAWYRLIIYVIVIPPALHAATIYLNTILAPWTGSWGIPAAPAPYDMWENAIIMGFLGVGATAQTVITAVREFRK